MPGSQAHQTTIVTFGRMAPDFSQYAGAKEEVALRSGCAMYSGQPTLIPKIRQILSGAAQTGLAGFAIYSTSSGFVRFFFNAKGQLFEWVPQTDSSALNDRTPVIAVCEAQAYEFFKFGIEYLAIPHARGTAAVALDYAIGDPRFEAMIPAGTQVLGPLVGQVRDHLLIAAGWDSVNGQEGNRFNWSARADHTLWTAGSNEAGFAYITGQPEGNDIEDLVSWYDFASFFTRTGIYRLGYQGGLEKWDLRQVGEAHQTVFQKSAIKAGRNAYYIGTDGPRVLVEGEESQPIARNMIARTLMDRTGSEWGIQSIVKAGYDKVCGLVWWVYLAVDGNWRVIIYHLESEEFTLLLLGDPTTNKWGAVGSFDEWIVGGKLSEVAGAPGVAAFFDQTKPLGSLVIVPDTTEVAANWRLWAQTFDDGVGTNSIYTTYQVDIESKILRLGKDRQQIVELRPLWRTNTAAEGLDLTISIKYGDTPRLESTETGVATPLSLSTADADSGGRVRTGLPGAKGRYHKFTVSFPEVSQTILKTSPFSDFQRLKELSGLEIVHTEAGR